MERPRPYSFLIFLINSFNVISPTISIQSHADHFHSSPLIVVIVVAGGFGSLAKAKLIAKFTKVFANFSMGFCNISLYNSKQTKPVTKAVVVAKAGIIFPAIFR